MATHRLAIDLGTSHTVAVVRRGDEAPRPLLFDGSPLLPSAVFAEPPRLHVGRDAERMSLVDPSRFEPHPKRRVDDGRVLLGNTEVGVVDMLAELLRRVAGEAAQAGVPAAAGTVLTCPVDWGAHRRTVLLNAARAAGLGPVELVDEPVAAATYCMDVLRQQVGIGRTVAVFDFGGGTLDVSVLRREPGGLRVLSMGGLDDLGGVDIDAALVGHLGQLIALRSPRVWQRISNPGPQSEQRERRQFWNEVRGAKEMLSRTSAAPIHVPGVDSALHLTREELERVAGPLIDRAVDETRRVLQRSGTDPGELAGLFLVGGSSRIPLVASRLHTRFGIAPTVPEQPELPVAYGGLLAGAGPSPAPLAPPVVAPRPVSTPPVAPVSYGGPVPVSPAITPGTGNPAFPASYPPIATAPAPPPLPRQPMSQPMSPPMSQPMGLHRPPLPPRRRGHVRYIVLAVVTVLVVSCGWGGYKIFQGVRNAVSGIGAGNNSPGPGGGGGGGGGGDAGDLRKLAAVTVPGDGALGMTVGPESVFYAGVSAGKIQVVALNSADGKERWNKTYTAEPTELRLRQTGGLLVVTGEKAATHQGKDIRLVIDAKTGDQKRLDAVDGQRVLALIGGDVVVETERPKATLQRIDLATGGAKWKADIKDVTGLGYASVPVLVHAPNGPEGAQGRKGELPWTVESADAAEWEQAVAADPTAVVSLDPDTGKATVWDAGTGKARATAAVPIEAEDWTAYAGVVVGPLGDRASPGRTTLAAFGTDNLAKRWELPLPAGADIERTKACGPQHVCVAYDGTASGDWTVSAVDVRTGKEVWKKTAGFGDEPDWYLMPAGLVYGEEQFGKIGSPGLFDPATGEKKHGLGGRGPVATAVAGAGKWVAMHGVRTSLSGTVWTFFAVDVGSAKATSAVDVSDKLIKFTSARGGVVAALAEDRKLVVALVPSAAK